MATHHLPPCASCDPDEMTALSKNLPDGLEFGDTVVIGSTEYVLPTKKAAAELGWWVWRAPREELWLMEKENLGPDANLTEGFGWVSFDPAPSILAVRAKQQTTEDTELAALLYAAASREIGAGGRPDTIMAVTAAADRLSRGE